MGKIHDSEEICGLCRFWMQTNTPHHKGFRIGICECEPDDVHSMSSDSMAIVCGHDGPIIVGRNFGCVHWDLKAKKCVSCLEFAEPGLDHCREHIPPGQLCPQCQSDTGIKIPNGLPIYCEDCGWPDSDFDEEMKND